MTRRVILDMTDIWLHLARGERVTGIQRVVLKTAKHITGSDKAEVILGYYNRRYNLYSYFNMEAGFDDLEALRKAVCARHLRPFRPEKYKGRPISRAYQTLLKKWLPALRRLAATRGMKSSELRFRDGDIILSLGCGWASPDMFNLVEPLVRKHRVTLIVMIHDLSTILGEFPVAEKLCDNFFHQWLTDLARYVRKYLVYSEATKKELGEYLETLGVKNYRIGKTGLAHEFRVGDPGPVSENVAAITGKEFVLAVISYPPPGNKNLERLLEAWIRLSTGPDSESVPTLVVAGGVGPSNVSDEVLLKLGGKLELVFRPNDTELGDLYESALFTVLPSTREGWGLTIGESLWHGKFCVTSGVSSMPEVGGSFCDYFDPFDVDDMIRVLRRPIQDRDYLRMREAAIDHSALVSWEQSTEHLLDAALHLVREESPALTEHEANQTKTPAL